MKILPILLITIGIAGGVSAGLFLKPADDAGQNDQRSAGDKTVDEAAKKNVPRAVGVQDSSANSGVPPDGSRSYVKIGRQTIVPVVNGGKTDALMLFELAVDVPSSESQRVVGMEPRLRDAFLRELLKMSHTGAFMDNFTNDAVIEELRRNLVSAARRHLGPSVNDVLILDVMRQEK